MYLLVSVLLLERHQWPDCDVLGYRVAGHLEICPSVVVDAFVV